VKTLILALMIGAAMLLSAAEQPSRSVINNNKYDKVLFLDNFDDGELNQAPEWWVFDALKPSFVKAETPAQGVYYLRLQGSAKNYYIGGMGFYFGRDAAQYDAVVLDVKGSGRPAILRIQLFEDDHGGYTLEQDANFQPTQDDQWEHELLVDWEGWRTVEIPFSRFVLANPGVGDGIWNPDTENGYCGLLHFQLILALPKAEGSADIGLNNLCFVRLKNK